MASKIKVDQIEGQSGSTVSLPAGQTLDLSSGTVTLPNSSVNLSTQVTNTLPVAKGGTGLTSLGSAGQVVKVNSGASALEFGTAPSGKILATYQDVKTDAFTSNSSSLVDITGFEITGITPASSSSKFLISVTFGAFQTSANNTRAFGTLIRTVGGSDTQLNVGDAAQGHEHTFGVCLRNNAGEHSQIPVTYTFLDSPNTASSVAYKVQVTKGSDSGYVTINKTYSATDERANVASAMQVMEISS